MAELTGWEHFEHDADMGVRGRGPTLAAAFEQAARALTGVITDPAGLAEAECVRVTCTAPDDEVLLVDWLNALVYEMAVRRLLFGRFRVRTWEGAGEHGPRTRHLAAEAWGELVRTASHRPAVEVKGATYTALHVAREGEGWVAQCVVDV